MKWGGTLKCINLLLILLTGHLLEQPCVSVGFDDGEICIAKHRKLFNVFGAVEKNIDEF